MRVCHPNAKSYRDQEPQQIYRIHENNKKRLYSRRVLDVEHGSFTPLVFTSTGGMGKECMRYHSRLAELIAELNHNLKFFSYYHFSYSYSEEPCLATLCHELKQVRISRRQLTGSSLSNLLINIRELVTCKNKPTIRKVNKGNLKTKRLKNIQFLNIC